MPSRHRLFVPFNMSAPRSRLVSMPFSFCKLPTGTTMDELVKSGRSVSIGVSGWVHSAALHAKLARETRTRAANLMTDHSRRLVMQFLPRVWKFTFKPSNLVFIVLRPL